MFDDEKDSSERLQQYLANQRIFLSWVRTSIALIGLGFAIERFSIFLQQFRLIADLTQQPMQRLQQHINIPL